MQTWFVLVGVIIAYLLTLVLLWRDGAGYKYNPWEQKRLGTDTGYRSYNALPKVGGVRVIWRYTNPRAKMTKIDEKCECCMGESGGVYITTAQIPGHPMTIRWCNECISRNAVPSYVFDYDFIFGANGRINNIPLGWRKRSTWADGNFIDFDAYIIRFSDQDVKKAQEDYLFFQQEVMGNNKEEVEKWQHVE